MQAVYHPATRRERSYLRRLRSETSSLSEDRESRAHAVCSALLGRARWRPDRLCGIGDVRTQRDQQLAVFGIKGAKVDSPVISPCVLKQVMLSIGQKKREKDAFSLYGRHPVRSRLLAFLPPH